MKTKMMITLAVLALLPACGSLNTLSHAQAEKWGRMTELALEVLTETK